MPAWSAEASSGAARGRRPRRSMRGRHGGQSLVEFALVAPLFLALVFGIIGGAWLYFMNEAVNDAARSAAREASIRDPLVTLVGAQTCEAPADATFNPQTIEGAAQQAANILPVNANQLCATSATVLAQSAVSGRAAIQVQASPDLSGPATVTATVTYTAQLPIPGWAPTVDLQASSTLAYQCPPGSC